MTGHPQSPAKRIVAIAWPAIVEAYLQNLLGVVDTIFIARIGLVAIAAVGVTNIYSMTYIGVFMAVSTALSVFLSRAFGGNDTQRGNAAVAHGLAIAVIVGVVFSLLSLLGTTPLLHLMGAYGKLEHTAWPYFRIVLGISPLIALFTAQASAFRAIGDTKTPLRIGLEMNAIHMVLDYILIFGIGPVHGFGLMGAAWAMFLARVYASVRLWWKSRRVQTLHLVRSNLKLQPRILAGMTRFAVPAALERLSMRLGQIIYFGLIVRMGIDVYATHNIAGTLTIFASTVGSGFATAATTTIGQAIGSGDTASVQSYRHWSYILSATSMTIVTALIFLLSPWIGLLFTHNSNVLHLLFIVLAIDTLAQPFLAAVLVDTSAIQAGGNSKFPMLVTALGIWLIRTLGVYFLAWRMGWGLPAVWGSIALDNMTRAVLFARYRKKRNLIHTLSQ